jgi:hypothetical protein
MPRQRTIQARLSNAEHPSHLAPALAGCHQIARHGHLFGRQLLRSAADVALRPRRRQTGHGAFLNEKLFADGACRPVLTRMLL